MAKEQTIAQLHKRDEVWIRGEGKMGVSAVPGEC